jgi:hypothetical protein
MKVLQNIFTFLLIAFAFIPILGFSQSSFIPTKQAICGGSCPVIDSNFSFTKESITNFILSLARFLTYIGGALAVLFIVYGGFLILTDFGDSKRSAAGWSCIQSSIIGLLIIILAYTAVAFISSVLTNVSLDNITSL